MTIETFKADIPLSTAIAAYNGTSMSPERRGESTVNEYAQTLENDYATLSKIVQNKPDLQLVLETEFARYRTGYRERYLAYLHSSSRCVSSFIAGPSNFPAARMNKRAGWAHNKLTELVEFRTRALEAIRRTLHPEWRPIMAGDNDACERLAEKIADAEKLQAVMKDCNAAMRKHSKAGAGAQVKAMAAVLVAHGMDSDDAEYKAQKLLEPDFAGRVGFADFELQNNNANLRRMKQRLGSISAAKQVPEIEAEGVNARFEDCPAENRVRLFFPGKPDGSVRSRLKSGGFRWTPSLGCWQAYRHNHTIELAKREAGLGQPQLGAHPEASRHWADMGPDYTPLAPDFVERIEFLANRCGKTPWAVYILWQKYAKDCELSDQSALLPEFEDWYKSDLAPAL